MKLFTLNLLLVLGLLRCSAEDEPTLHDVGAESRISSKEYAIRTESSGIDDVLKETRLFQLITRHTVEGLSVTAIPKYLHTESSLGDRAQAAISETKLEGGISQLSLGAVFGLSGAQLGELSRLQAAVRDSRAVWNDDIVRVKAGKFQLLDCSLVADSRTGVDCVESSKLASKVLLTLQNFTPSRPQISLQARIDGDSRMAIAQSLKAGAATSYLFNGVLVVELVGDQEQVPARLIMDNAIVAQRLKKVKLKGLSAAKRRREITKAVKCTPRECAAILIAPENLLSGENAKALKIAADRAFIRMIDTLAEEISALGAPMLGIPREDRFLVTVESKKTEMQINVDLGRLVGDINDSLHHADLQE